MADAVKVSLEVATKNAEAAVQSFTDKILKSDKTWQNFTANLLSKAVTSGVGFLRDQMGQMYSKAIEEAKNAEREINSLNVSLQQNGLYSAETSKRFQDLGDEIEATTLYTGGAILENTALLASMTSLNESGIERTIRAATELAATYDIDLNTATENLAKASRGNTTAIQKLGLEFDSTGGKGKTFESILAALEARQGTAAAKANTYEGAQKKIEDASNKAYEAIGGLITQNPAVLSAMNSFAGVIASAASALERFGKWVQENSTVIEVFAVGAGLLATGLAVVAVKALLATTSFAALTTAATTAWVAVTGPVGIAVAALAAAGTAIYAIVKYWKLIESAAYSAIAATLEYASKATGAIGASGVTQSLREQAAGYREKATEAKAAFELEVNGNSAAATAAENKAGRVRAALDEEAEARIKATNDWVQNLAKTQNDEEKQRAARLEAVRREFEERGLIELEGDEINYALKLERERQYFDERLQLQIEAREADLQRIDESTASDQQKADARLQIERDFHAKSAAMGLEFSNKAIDIQKKQRQQEERLSAAKVADVSSTLGAISSLTQSQSKELFFLGKAAAAANAAINIAQGVTKAWGIGGPFGAPLAALVAAAGAVQIANIMSASPGFANGGIVPGTSFTGDRVTARVNSSEMILNRRQQTNLFNQIDRGGGGSDVVGAIRDLISVVREGTSVQIDGREIVGVVRDGLASGRAIA